MKQPNILFIMTDQQRWDALGCETAWLDTPNMDRIAREGLRFTSCVTNSPECVPTRRAMASGLYAHNTHLWGNRQQRKVEFPNWISCIRRVGYRTSLFGKTHLNPHGGDLRAVEHVLQAQGIDDVNETAGPRGCMQALSHMTAEWQSLGLWEAFRADMMDRYLTKPWVVRPSSLPLEQYYDVWVGRKAREYLEAYDRAVPWFCWVSFPGPHEPWDTPEPYASRYDPADMPAPLNGDLVGAIQRKRGHLNSRLLSRPPITPEDVAAMRANYAGSVTLIDEMIGGLLEAVEARGELDNTVIALVSDHGEMNGDYGLIYKSNFLESAARVPCLLRTPETARRVSDMSASSEPVTCNVPIEWFDMGPTLVDLAGGKIEHRQFAKSLLPCVEEPTTLIREESLCELFGEIMVRNEKWKMAVNREGKCYLLFDLQNDRHEAKNLAGDARYDEVEHELRLRMLERLVATQLA